MRAEAAFALGALIAYAFIATICWAAAADARDKLQARLLGDPPEADDEKSQ